MDCRKAIELITIETGNRISSELMVHLDSCPQCRVEYEAQERLIHSLRGLQVPEPPEDFWGKLRADVRQGIKGQERAGANGGKSRFTLMGTPLWQRVLAPAMLVIALVSAYVLYAPGHRTPDRVAATALQETKEAGVEIFMEMDTEDATITLMILDAYEHPDSIYYEFYGLSEKEIANFYDSLGLMMESM